MFEDFFLFFSSDLWQNIISILKPLSFLAIFIFIWVIIWTLRKSPLVDWYIRTDAEDFFGGGPYGVEKKAQAKWKKIEKRLKSKQESDWKLAIIEGEEIVSEVLFEMGYQGEDIGKQLKGASEVHIPHLKSLLKASEVYSNIISDPDYALKKEESEEIIKNFKDFLKNFEYL